MMVRRLDRVVGLVAVLSWAASAAAGQEDRGGAGTRVITKFGTVLTVGRQVVDDERRHESARGVERGSFRVYRVEVVNGPWLWLVAEKEDVRGWVKAEQVVPLDEAIRDYTEELREHPSSAVYVDRGLIWKEKGEPDIAIADFNEAIRLEPDNEVAYLNRGNAWLAKGMYARAIADYGEAIRLDPKYARAYNNRAWVLATAPVAKYRDGKEAVATALRACELTGWTMAGTFQTLAAAHAEAGDFAAAIKCQEKAIELAAKDGPNLKGYRSHLDLYLARKPYRQGVETR